MFNLLQNLRDEVAMDVDEDEDSTQRPKQVHDYGIEVDFSALDEEEREVSLRRAFGLCNTLNVCRETIQKRLPNLMHRSVN